ncbi:unnamed protein product [Didymodactylos carnosus]|uniref:Uncharacterized protein n=1 Tax=Didymodactylos carnosus TaxID=1234261 RepID=A0A815EMF5_9BILA|nr:unnamed protein product [Didymodactylos carnosus]CAF4153323.1 unnamed protein product [Didymodactylos carnosus]
MDRCCSCVARLLRASDFRRLAPPVFRMFISIRVLKTLPWHTKVCNKCRQSYAYWKRCNPEFTNIFDRIEEEFVENSESEDDQVEDMDTNAAADKECQTIEQDDGTPSITLPLNCTVCSHKSIRTAVACLLSKLRLGLSNTVLGLLFELPDKRAVSRVSESYLKEYGLGAVKMLLFLDDSS